MITRLKRSASNRTKHPMGSGKPGPENWSGTDNNTIRTAPLGGVPELVKWSASVVLTPRGWVGRVDNHITGKTIHCEVQPNLYSEALERMNAVRKMQEENVLTTNGKNIRLWLREVFDYSQEDLDDLGLTDEDLAEMFLEADFDDDDWLREELEEYEDAMTESIDLDLPDWYKVHEVWR